MLLETLDMRVSNSCACMCSAMMILYACVGSGLYVKASGVFSLNDSSLAISAMVRV